MDSLRNPHKPRNEVEPKFEEITRQYVYILCAYASPSISHDRLIIFIDPGYV